MLGFKGLFAEYERVKNSEKFRRGKLYKAKIGKVIQGHACYGYSYVSKTQYKEAYFKINKYEAGIVKQIFQWVVTEGLTVRGIVKRLQRLKIQPRKSKRGVWSTGTISRMLRNESYIGKSHYNKSQAVVPKNPLKNQKYKRIKKTSRRKRPREEWFEIPIPPILSEDVFYKVQKQLDANSHFSPRNGKHNDLLAGLLYCECSYCMGGEGGNTQNRYYRCRNRIYRFSLKRTCFAKGVNVERLDRPVWDKVKSLLTNKKLLREQAERWLTKKEMEKVKGLSEAEIESLENSLKGLIREEKRQAKAYGEGLISFETFKELAEEIKFKKTSLERQLGKLKIQRLKEQKQPQLTIDEVCKLAPGVLEGFLKEEKQVVLRKLVDRILVNKERTFATIRGHIPLYLQSFNRKVVLRAERRDSWSSKCG